MSRPQIIDCLGVRVSLDWSEAPDDLENRRSGVMENKLDAQQDGQILSVRAVMDCALFGYAQAPLDRIVLWHVGPYVEAFLHQAPGLRAVDAKVTWRPVA